MLKNIEVEDDEKKLIIISEHVPVSVSIFFNVPGYDNKPRFICNDNPIKLISEFIKTILKISSMAEELNKNKYANIIEFLDAYVKNTKDVYDEFIEWRP